MCIFVYWWLGRLAGLCHNFLKGWGRGWHFNVPIRALIKSSIADFSEICNIQKYYVGYTRTWCVDGTCLALDWNYFCTYLMVVVFAHVSHLFHPVSNSITLSVSLPGLLPTSKTFMLCCQRESEVSRVFINLHNFAIYIRGIKNIFLYL